MVTMYVVDNVHVNVNFSDAILIVDRECAFADGSLVWRMDKYHEAKARVLGISSMTSLCYNLEL